MEEQDSVCQDARWFGQHPEGTPLGMSRELTLIVAGRNRVPEPLNQPTPRNLPLNHKSVILL